MFNPHDKTCSQCGGIENRRKPYDRRTDWRNPDPAVLWIIAIVVIVVAGGAGIQLLCR